MNKIHRTVWSQARGCYVVAHEHAATGGQSSGVRTAVTAALLTLSAGGAFGVTLPTDGNVVAGSGSIAQSGNVMTVTQSSSKLAIDWQSFSIGQGGSVNFVQPSASSVALNRVIGTDVSSIQGSLTANGQVFLVNPNGVLFSTTAQVNVGGLVASTQGISNADFMAGNYHFVGTSSNAIINQGNIVAADGGTIAIVAAKITNDGSLTAQGGNVLLGAGSDVLLDMGGPVKLQIKNDTLQTLIQNGGIIKADGGTVWLTSQAAGNLASSVINNTGVIEADKLATGETGQVVLYAHDGDMQVGGTIQAEGGSVETSGKTFSVAKGATVKAGSWLIDPVNITIDSTLAESLSTALGSGSVTISTAGSKTPSTSSNETSGDGNIDVNSDIAWATDNTLTLRADNNISVNANITHTGTSAGGIIFLYGQGTADGGSSTYSNATGTVTSPSIQWRKGSDLNSTRYAIVDGNYFLGGKYIEIGICGPTATNCTGGAGKFGTTNTPSLFFGRQGGGSGVGMIGDADGFGVGADLRIDYFLPGSPAEEFTVGYTGVSDAVNFATTANSGTFSFLGIGTDGAIKLDYSTVLNGSLKVDQVISLKATDTYFNNTVTLTNVSAAALDNVRFARSFDPDNTVDIGGDYTTVNKVELTTAAGDGANVVSATSQAGDAYATASGGKTAKILYYSTDANTAVGYGDVFFSGGDLNTMASLAASEAKGSSQTDDIGIGIIYTAGTLSAGASKSFSYLTSLDNRDISAILGDLGVASGAHTTTTTNVPQTAAVITAQSSATNTAQTNTTQSTGTQTTSTQTPNTLLSSASLPNVSMGSTGDSISFLGSSGGLAFVGVNMASSGGGTGSSSTSSSDTAAGASASGSSDSGGSNSADASPSTTSVVLPTESAGLDPFGFMRVFVVNGGINLPGTADLTRVGQNNPTGQDKQ